MKSKLLLVTALPMLAGQLCLAQPASADDSQPATSNVAGQQYPRIHSDLRVSFRLKAPDAQKVRVHVDKDYDMGRGTNGVCSVTTNAAGAGVPLLLVHPRRRERVRPGQRDLLRRDPLEDPVKQMEDKYGQAKRVWVVDRGIVD